MWPGKQDATGDYTRHTYFNELFPNEPKEPEHFRALRPSSEVLRYVLYLGSSQAIQISKFAWWGTRLITDPICVGDSPNFFQEAKEPGRFRALRSPNETFSMITPESVFSGITTNKFDLGRKKLYRKLDQNRYSYPQIEKPGKVTEIGCNFAHILLNLKQISALLVLNVEHWTVGH